ncbi:MAG: tRNA (N6-threonylcarbamoyladenosine(37)-N6)-methyltransferase TrmO [Acetobacteraceae bacterium]
MARALTIHPIGVITTPWKTPDECPRNGRQPLQPPLCGARIFADFVPGLRSLEGFTHLILLYWLDRVRTPKLTFVPPFDQQERGVFATRSPARPNPIGLSVVAFEGLDGPDTLLVRNLDCIDGTPLIDIKPYLRTTDAEPDAAMGWLALYATRRRPLA